MGYACMIIPSVLENFILAIVTIILVSDGHDMAWPSQNMGGVCVYIYI